MGDLFENINAHNALYCVELMGGFDKRQSSTRHLLLRRHRVDHISERHFLHICPFQVSKPIA